MEYKVSSFEFTDEFSREEKHFIILRINSFRSKCPSDATFSGSFVKKDKNFSGSINVLFSKGEFVAEGNGIGHEELMTNLEGKIWQQIEIWRETRFTQNEKFVNFQKKKGS